MASRGKKKKVAHSFIPANAAELSQAQERQRGTIATPSSGAAEGRRARGADCWDQAPQPILLCDPGSPQRFGGGFGSLARFSRGSPAGEGVHAMGLPG